MPTGVVVRIHNPSALPQAFGCTNLPAGIRVFPNHGFGYILPGARCLLSMTPATHTAALLLTTPQLAIMPALQ